MLLLITKICDNNFFNEREHVHSGPKLLDQALGKKNEEHDR